jgi:pimeloyl-ACP methyl ester carboxylesterase
MALIPVDESGTAVYVEDTGGNGDSKPIFFVHGWPLDHKMFEVVILLAELPCLIQKY